MASYLRFETTAGGYRHTGEVWINWQNAQTNQSSIHFKYSIHRNYSASQGSWSLTTCKLFRMWDAYSGNHDNCATFDFRQYADRVMVEYDLVLTHDVNGYLNVPASIYFAGHSSSFPAASASGTLSLDRIPRPPAAPTIDGVDSITPNSFGVRYHTNADNGGGITSHEVEWRQGGTLVWTDYGARGYSNPAGVGRALNPGTTYTVRARVGNVAGMSPWSNTISQSTLPGTAPDIGVLTSPLGTEATVLLTPPTGVTTVNEYVIEREWLTPLPVPQPAVITIRTPSSPYLAQGLSSGTTYRWRAAAVTGGYQSPWSAWVEASQPQPATGAGDYFDGATADTPDVNYSWVGAANNSASQALAKSPLGWGDFAGGNNTPGAGGVVMRSTGGFSGTYAARVILFADQTFAGSFWGTSGAAPYRVPVESGTFYTGSIYVQPSRDTRGAARIVWYDGALPVGGETGTDMLVDSTAWTRVTVGAQVPPGVTHATIGFTTVEGDGYEMLRAGDYVLLDAAMISLGIWPYFDGSTPDTPNYQYDWDGTAHNSTSHRTTLEVPETALVDPDCTPIPAPPRAPEIPSDCIEEIGVWRRYWAQINAYEVEAWLDSLPTLAITTGGVAARQVRIRYYPNPFNRGWDLIDPEDFCSEQIVSFQPAESTLTLDGVSRRAWIELNQGRTNLQADHLLYGSNGTPATWPVLSCNIPYLVSIDVPTDAPVGNLSFVTSMTVRH